MKIGHIEMILNTHINNKCWSIHYKLSSQINGTDKLVSTYITWKDNFTIYMRMPII
jgi:hypothetical protein